MNNLRKKLLALLLLPLLGLLLVSSAGAVGESALVEYSVKPIKKKFSTKGYQPASLEWGVEVAPAAGAVTILPMRVADMKFPPKKTMLFQPAKKLRACKKSEPLLVGPAPLVYERCPGSIVGNGEATFQLGQSASPLAFRKGTVVVLYGGMSGKNVRLRFSAWSGDTNAGVVAEGVLQPSGRMLVEMPVLTADSAVTSLRLSVPGKRVAGTWGSGEAYELLPGQDRGFVRVRCRTGQNLSFGASLLLGARNPQGYPYGPEEKLYPKAASRCGL